MHPAKEGFSALPFFDEFDLSTVDILLISQYVILLPSSTRTGDLGDMRSGTGHGVLCSMHPGCRQEHHIQSMPASKLAIISLPNFLCLSVANDSYWL